METKNNKLADISSSSVEAQLNAHKELTMLAEISRFLNLADSAEDIYAFISKKIHAILGNSIVFVSVLESDSPNLILVAYEGIGSRLEKVIEVLGFDLRTKKFPLAEMESDDLIAYRTGKLVYIEEGIYTLLLHKTPKIVCDLAAKAFNISHVFAIGFVHKTDDFGGIILLSETKDKIENKAELLETIVSQTASVLWRIRTEEKSRASEIRFRTLTNNLPDIISRFNKELKYTYINPAIQKIAGISPDLFIGRGINEILIPAGNAFSLNNKILGVFQTGEACRFEFDLITLEGRRYFSSRIIPEYNEQGAVISVLSVARDITERKLAEDAMRESEHRYRKMVQILPDGVIIHTDGKSVFANEAARRIMNADSIDKMIGRSVIDFVHPDYKDLVKERIQNSFLNLTKMESIEETFITFDGKTIQVEVTATPFVYQGKPSMITVFTDITARKKVIEALRESEERYRSMVQILPDGIIIDTDGKIVYANEAALKIMNFKSIHQILGRNAINFVPLASRSRTQNDPDKSLDEKVPFKSEEENLITLDGKSIQVAVTATPFIFQGKASTLTVFTDITQRRKAEKELESNINLLQSIINSSNDAIYVKDLEQKIILCNKAYSWALNKTVEDIIGKTDIENGWKEELINGNHELGIAGFKAEDQAAIEGEIVHITNEKIFLTDELHYFDTLKLPLHNKEGVIVGMFGISRDITERQLSEERISLLNQQLELRVEERTAQLTVSNKELESFAYSVSHDLRAPLRAIDGFSQLLIESYADSMNQQAKSYLDRISAGSRNMSKLIDDLLNLSRVSRIEMNYQPVNLSKLADEISRELLDSSPERSIQFKISPGLEAIGDMHLLKAALDNLLRNSWKFTSKRTSAHIEFGSKEIDGKEVMFIRDNGAGFDMTYADKLFIPFQRLHVASEFPGTGIGLATVQRIISRHGGKIWADSIPDQGATFYFTISQRNETSSTYTID